MYYRRSVGYCDNLDCEDFSKGTFLLNHSSPQYWCVRCRTAGWIEPEATIDDDTHDGLYKTVKIEFNFNALTRTYANVAIVDVPGLREGGTFTLKSPLIRTENRALKLGENMIVAVNSGRKDRDGFGQEMILHMDEDRATFKKELEKFEEDLEVRDRRLRNGT